MEYSEYKKASIELRKGSVTEDDLIKLNKFLKDYKDTLNKFLQAIAKLANSKDMTFQEIMKQISQEEKYYSEKVFKKDKLCLTREEHMEFMNIFYDNVLDKPHIREIKFHENPEARNDKIKNYLEGRIFYEAEKLYT